MRSAALFVAMLAVGVGIVMVYLWSGESIVVLFLAITTLFVVLAVLDRKPWAPVDGEPGDGRPPRRPTPVWRCGHDITWDARGLSGVPVGQQAPQLWAWSQIDDISRDWCIGGKEEAADERIGLRLDFPNMLDVEEPENAFVSFGPTQHPDRAVRAAREAWRDYKVTRSRFYQLSPGERIRRLADDLGTEEIDLREPTSSPELLFEQLRLTLLSRGELSQVDLSGDVEDLLDDFDQLLNVKGVEPLTDDEADELLAIEGDGRLESIVWSLDWAAEQRGLRLAFLDQPSGADQDGRRRQLVGLLPASSAEDWDGQAVGGGSTRVTLDPPFTG